MYILIQNRSTRGVLSEIVIFRILVLKQKSDETGLNIVSCLLNI